MEKNETDLNLLYISGSKAINKLIEEKYPGEDVFVNLSFNNDALLLQIEDAPFSFNIKDISLIDVVYEDSSLVITTTTEDIFLSYENEISLEFLHFLSQINVNKKMPEFIQKRFPDKKEIEIINLVEKHFQENIYNEYVHFHPNIDENAFLGIVAEFAHEAIAELPLIYVKYIDSGDQEFGLLVTNKRVYSPENTILLKDIKSIAYDEQFGIVDTILLYFNEELFTNMQLIIWDRKMSSFSSAYKKEFFAENLFNLIGDISDYVSQNQE